MKNVVYNTKIFSRAQKGKNEFVEFLKNYKVIELAIGVVIGNAVKDLVTSIAQDLIMPIIGIFTPSGSWKNIAINILGSDFKIGNFISASLDFAIVAIVVFIVVKKLLKIDGKI